MIRGSCKCAKTAFARYVLGALAEGFDLQGFWAAGAFRAWSSARLRRSLPSFCVCARVCGVAGQRLEHTMVQALAEQVGAFSLEGIVATSVEPAAQVRGFRYFHGGHPTPNAESIRAASAMLKDLRAQTASSLVIFLLSGGGSSIVWRSPSMTRSKTRRSHRHLSRAGALGRAHRGDQRDPQTSFGGEKAGGWRRPRIPAQQISLLVSDVPDNTPDALASGPDHARIRRPRKIVTALRKSAACCRAFPAAARSCLNDARSRKRPSRPIRRFAIRAGERCSRIKLLVEQARACPRKRKRTS